MFFIRKSSEHFLKQEKHFDSEKPGSLKSYFRKILAIDVSSRVTAECSERVYGILCITRGGVDSSLSFTPVPFSQRGCLWVYYTMMVPSARPFIYTRARSPRRACIYIRRMIQSMCESYHCGSDACERSTL